MKGRLGAEATVEREREIASLERALESAGAGGGGTLVLEGAAGTGKTHLVEIAAELAGGAGLRVLRGRGAPLAGASSFGLALELLAPLLAEEDASTLHLERLLEPVRGQAEPDPEAAGLTGLELAQAGVRAARRRPLALLVDDLHWADPPSLLALAAIAHRAPQAAICLLVAVRLGEPVTDEGALAELRGAPSAEILRPRPLSSAGVGAVLEACGLPEVGEEAAGECARLTGGNPLLVTQVAAAVAADSEPLTQDRLRRLRGDGLLGVGATVEAQLRRLGGEATRIAGACAVLGEESTLRNAAVLTGVDLDVAADAVDRLTAAGVLMPGETLRFSHPLVRAAVYDAIPAASREEQHRRAAEQLAEQGVDAERVATQLLRGTPAGSDAAAAILAAAAEQALARGVPEAAAAYLGRAMKEPPAVEQRARVMLRLGFAEALLGRPTAGEWLSRARAAATTAEVRAEADLRLGRHLYASGSYQEAEGAFERGRAELGDDDKGWIGAQLLAGSLAAARYAGSVQPGGTDERLTAVLERSAVGSSTAERELLAELAVELGVRGEPRERVVTLALRAWADGVLAETGDRHGIVVSQVAAALVWSDAYAEAEAVLDRALAHAEAIGVPSGAATARYMRSWVRFYRGELDAAAADAQAALATEGWDMYRPAAQGVIAQVWIERGELEEAERALALRGGDAEWRETIPFALVLEARGRLAAARGDDDAALALLLECGERVAPMGSHQPYSRWRVEAARCLARLGEPARARALAEAELTAARRAGAPRILGTALIAIAATAAPAAAIDSLREAVGLLADGGARLERARALCLLGEAIRDAGRPAEARPPLREALSLADELGAALLADQAAAALSAAGGRPRRRRLDGASALTPAELRVARLAAAGQSNPEIATRLVVAEKTVQFHLTNAYRKLGIDSRADLPPGL